MPEQESIVGRTGGRSQHASQLEETTQTPRTLRLRRGTAAQHRGFKAHAHPAQRTTRARPVRASTVPV